VFALFLASGDRGRWPGVCVVVGVAGGFYSAGWGWERCEPLECALELFGPRPGRGEVQLAAASGEREPCSDVQQPVAHAFRFSVREFAVEHECLGPDDEVVREHHDLQPDFVQCEHLERELLKAGVLVIADAVLDPGALTLSALEGRDLPVGLVGQDRLEAVAIVIGERQLRAGVWTLRPDDTREAVGHEARSSRSVISTTQPFSRSLSS
jgi:hypothetical protein